MTARRGLTRCRRKSVGTLLKALGKGGSVRITFNERRARFIVEQGVTETQPTDSDFRRYLEAIEEAYPNYRQALLKEKASG